MKYPLSISNFLEETSSLSHSIVFLYFFALVSEDGFLISPCYSLKLCIQMGISFLLYFAFSFSLFTAICKASSDSHLPFWISFSWGWFLSWPPLECHEPPSIVLQALCLSDLIPWIYLSLPLYNCMRFEIFPTFFNLSLNLAIRSSWSEPQSAPGLVFADCIELLHLWLQRT